MSLEHKVALVSGASRGIGQAIARELGRRGATVIGTATTEAGAQAISQDLQGRAIKGSRRPPGYYRSRRRGSRAEDHCRGIRQPDHPGQQCRHYP